MQWRSKWGHAFRGADLRGASAHFLQSFKNAFYLDQSVLKNAYVLKKSCKNRFSVGGSALEPPFASGDWRAEAPPSDPRVGERCYSTWHMLRHSLRYVCVPCYVRSMYVITHSHDWRKRRNKTEAAL